MRYRFEQGGADRVGLGQLRGRGSVTFQPRALLGQAKLGHEGTEQASVFSAERTTAQGQHRALIQFRGERGILGVGGGRAAGLG